MKCEDAILLIRPFIRNELSMKETKAFISHVKGCPECYDELEIRYLVEVTGKEISEEGKELSYDFSHALSDEIEKRLKRIRRVRTATFLAAAFIVLFLAGILLYFLYFKV